MGPKSKFILRMGARRFLRLNTSIFQLPSSGVF